MNTTIPRLLHALSAVEGGLSQHTIVTAMSPPALHLCTAAMHEGGHGGHCALDRFIRGPEGPVDWGSAW